MKKLFYFKFREKLGIDVCPYALRTRLVFLGFSIRVHEWFRSDDKRFMHDHPWWFLTLVLKDSYTDVSIQEGKIVRDELKRFSVRFRKANHIHYVEVPKTGCVTILITGRNLKRWGFWVKNKFIRPNKFFKRYGHPPCFEQ